MKKLYFFTVLLAGLYACNDEEVTEPDFEINLSKQVYAVNEPVTFDFTGTADIITFYSGAKGAEYEFRNRVKAEGIPQMSFSSNRLFGNTAAVIDTSLKLLASVDFKGIYNEEYIRLAKWKDITSRAKLATVSQATPDVFSGVIDLSDISKNDSLVYIAFKYSGLKTTFSQYQWIIKNINIVNKLPDGSLVTIKSPSTLSWGAVNILNPTKLWSVNGTTFDLTMTGGPANEPDNEDWIISQALELSRVQRSKGIAIRTSPLAKIPSYTFTGYSAPGIYTVMFEIINANKFDQKTVVKEFQVTVK